MSFIGAIQSGFRNYFNFKGKASRREFWYWILFTVLLGLVIGTIESIIWPAPEQTADWMQEIQNVAAQPTPLSNFLSFALLVPNGYGIFAGIGAVTVLNNAVPGAMLTSEELMSLIFLILPIFALFLAIMVVYIIMALRPSKSFYDGNKYVEPEPLDSSSEGTTA